MNSNINLQKDHGYLGIQSPGLLKADRAWGKNADWTGREQISASGKAKKELMNIDSGPAFSLRREMQTRCNPYCSA